MRPSGWQETFEEANVSEEHFRTLVDTIPALVWSARPDGSAEFVNQRWLDYTGLSAEQALRWGWTAAIHSDDRRSLIEYWRSILASGEPGEFEARMRRFDGEYRWFLFRGMPLRDATGAVVKWCGTNADIDDRKRAEIDLRRVLDSIPGLVATNTPTGETELVNRQMAQYFGRTVEELKGWRTLDAVHPDDLPFVVSTIEAWMRSPGATGPFEFDLRLRRDDGIYRWFHLRALPERETDGSVVRWYHLLTDIEQRRQAEETIRASELDLRLTVNSIPALVNILTASGEIEFTNQPLLDYFGRTLVELHGWAGSDVIHSEDLPTVMAAWKHSVETGTPFDLQHRLRRADGLYRWFHGRILPLRDQDDRIIRWYSVLTDVDDLKRAEEALRQTQSRLAQAAQIATVAELSASIAHEVNQPLAAVVANAHACLRWLSAEPPNLAKAVESAERIIRDGKDAGEVVRRIRALFSRAEAERVALDVNELIAEVVHLLDREMAKRHVGVSMHFAMDLPPVVGDRVQLQQLVLNLLLNAIESMDSVLDRPRTIDIHAKRRSGNAALIEIRDSGAGLRDPDRAFEAFFSTKENGMGMGLAICRSIIEEHNGELWAASSQGGGTTFSFTLPLKTGTAP
jgi:PAS domain S-box-containing protein